jgi:hypothetical protein
MFEIDNFLKQILSQNYIRLARNQENKRVIVKTVNTSNNNHWNFSVGTLPGENQQFNNHVDRRNGGDVSSWFNFQNFFLQL